MRVADIRRARVSPLLAALACAALAACGSSPPTRFYTLDPVPPGRPAIAFAGPPIQVGQVMLPPDLDRLSIVTRAGPDRLAVSGEDRWAAPLDGMTQRVLATDLAARLPRSQVLAPGDPAPSGGVRTVTVNVRRFDSDAAGLVTLDAGWALLKGTPPVPVRRGHEVITVQAGATAAGPEAAAMSRALAELADRIVRGIVTPGAR
ncbi:MAG: membrane integrity-associated transporter subunit PqiC [Acetobacteraceae bacterium]|nr:membrane integrity-associated transporter subunit PqiC [Acetobacteraceae bacterium]